MRSKFARMSPFPFRQKRGDLSDCSRHLKLSSYAPALTIEGLQAGIDNVRSDVFLSPRFVESARAYVSRLIARCGAIEEFLLEMPKQPQRISTPKAETPDFVAMLTELQLASLNRAKQQSKPSLDLLARLAIVKFLRSEMLAEYNVLLEKLRAKLKTYEGPHQQNAPATIHLRERIAKFQVDKKSILRRVGQELFQTLLELEKGALTLTRRSLFGEADEASYDLLHNRLLFAESPRDDFINAEHYVILGNYERDPDRLNPVLQLARVFFGSAALVEDEDEDESVLEALLTVPENADELFGGGTPDVAT